MKKRIISLALAAIFTFTLSSPALAASIGDGNILIADSITIHFETEPQSSRTSNNVLATLMSDDVIVFFEENELNYDFYSSWITAQTSLGLDSVTIAVTQPTATSATTRASSDDIEASRVVYAETIYHYTGQTNQLTVGDLIANAVSEVINLVIGKYSQTIASLASILGITDPSSYFGTERVEQNKDYYVNDASSRLVTKFVELYAPVSGTTKWYPWGFAQSDYVRHGVQLFYKGLENGAKENVYHQYYTQHYYSEASLVTLVKDAYIRGTTHEEVAEEYASAIGGYVLFDRDITATKYLEYDEYF